MRLALYASPVLLAAALVGCSNSSAPAPTGAVTLGLTDNGGSCNATGLAAVPTATDGTPPVSDTAVDNTITLDAKDCSVVPGSGNTYSVYATFNQQATDISVSITSISSSASVITPAVGSVSVTSLNTGGEGLSGACSFYFANTSEKVSAGSIWVDFTCAGLVANTNSSDVCGADNGVLYLDNCPESSQ